VLGKGRRVLVKVTPGADGGSWGPVVERWLQGMVMGGGGRRAVT